MRLVIIESPYAGDIERNLAYAKLCIRDAISRNESPYASHVLIPGALDDNDPAQRDRGIRAGYAWWQTADLIAFYMDLGMSPGMHKALQRAKTMHKKVERRWLGQDALGPFFSESSFQGKITLSSGTPLS